MTMWTMLRPWLQMPATQRTRNGGHSSAYSFARRAARERSTEVDRCPRYRQPDSLEAQYRCDKATALNEHARRTRLIAVQNKETPAQPGALAATVLLLTG